METVKFQISCAILLALVGMRVALFAGGPCIRSDGLTGVCSASCQPECASTSPEDICGYKGLNNPVVCCLKAPENTKLRAPTLKSYPTLEGICTYFHRNSTQKCFGKPVPNGKSSVEGQDDSSSHVSAIGWSSLNGIKWRCGGSLISERHVLTSAHCLVSQLDKPDTVRIGAQSLSYYPERDDYYVRKIIYHSEYDPRRLYDDLAILEVFKKEPSTVTFQSPACVWTHVDLKTRAVSAYAYNNDVSQNITMQNWNVIDHWKCRPSYLSGALYFKGLGQEHVCAARTDEEFSKTCDDFPSQTLLSSNSDIPFIIGVSAYRKNCLAPTVYTQVSQYADWLEEVVSN